MAKELNSYRFDLDQVKSIKKLGFNATLGYETAWECFNSLRQSTIKEINGHFSKSDLYTLFSLQKKNKLPVKHIESLENYIAFINDCYSEGNYEFISKKDLVRKIEKLTSAQIYFLRMEIHMFWHSSKKVSAKRDLDDYIANLL